MSERDPVQHSARRGPEAAGTHRSCLATLAPSLVRSSAVVVALALLASDVRLRAGSELQGRDTLQHAYDLILNARFADAARDLAACHDAPRPACAVLDATRLWWRLQLDPVSRALDGQLQAAIERAIRETEGWRIAEPHRAEAWFYLGGAYGVRVQFRVLRVERLAAARDGKRIYDSLQTALHLDPALEDANFGLGLYQYYADIAPAATKMFRWLLLLPGGSRTEGLARMLRARDRGTLVRSEADYQLHVLYLWYEHNFTKALELAEDLASRYPGNPLFLATVADVHENWLHDPTLAARSYERLLALAQDGKVNESALAITTARLGLAKNLETLYESDRALTLAQAVITAHPESPAGAIARAWVEAGRALQHLGRMDESRRAFDAALAATPADDPLRVRDQVRRLRRPAANANESEAYRIALAGWRAYQRHAYDEAESTLAHAVRLRPDDMIGRYRYGAALAARGHLAAARVQWERVAGAGATTPAPVYAEACVALAALVERDGDLQRALELYRRAAQTFGASADTRAAASRHVERLRRAVAP